ncbi:MAG TPA: type II secretion system F family protein [Candidatus Limnocylindria bacterium]|jgi:tight adherence protein B|nr:type II secretion system F family protein [Candidatus Limnocylindria bacterium]
MAYSEYVLPGIMFIGILFFFWGISTMLSGGGASVEERMARYAGGTTVEAAKKDSKGKTGKRKDIDPFATLSSDVQDKRFSIRVQRDLARANLKLRVAEYYYIRIGLALGLGLVLGVLRDPLSGVIGVIIGYFLPRMWVGRRIGGRLSAFNKQLADTITLLSNSLRAGSSFLQSIELVSRETPAPMGEEMGRVVREVNLGLGMEEALSNLVRRIKSDDLDLMVTAIGVQQQVGGNLAEILDTIAFTIRERVRIKGEINTLTAQGRMSGYLVAFLPIGIAVTLNFINPSFMQPLFTQLLGQILLGVGGVMMVIGFFAIQKIVSIKV